MKITVGTAGSLAITNGITKSISEEQMSSVNFRGLTNPRTSPSRTGDESAGPRQTASGAGATGEPSPPIPRDPSSSPIIDGTGNRMAASLRRDLPSRAAPPGSQGDSARTPMRKERRIAADKTANSRDGSPDLSHLEKLPQELLLDVWDHVQLTDLNSVGSAALASKAMYASVKASGIPEAARLVLRAQTARNTPATAGAVLEQVVASALGRTVRLTSNQRMAIIKTLQPQYLAGRNITTAVVALVATLDPEHQGEAVRYASNLFKLNTSDDVGYDNIEPFDKLAEIVVSMRSDEDKSLGLCMLHCLGTIPIQERALRFDIVASVIDGIMNEQAKAKGLHHIVTAMNQLPPPEMRDRFLSYASVVQSLQDDRRKARISEGMAAGIGALSPNDRRSAFDRVVSIAGSIDDAGDKRLVFSALRRAHQYLPPEEHAAPLPGFPW